MAFAETHDEFFDTANGFAVTATWKGSTAVDVIMDEEYFEDRTGSGAGVAGTQPVALCPLARVPGVAVGDTLQVPSGGQLYHVVGIEPDGVGLVRLVLEKQ